jgi:hypothetical protein
VTKQPTTGAAAEHLSPEAVTRALKSGKNPEPQRGCIERRHGGAGGRVGFGMADGRASLHVACARPRESADGLRCQPPAASIGSGGLLAGCVLPCQQGLLPGCGSDASVLGPEDCQQGIPLGRGEGSQQSEQLGRFIANCTGFCTVYTGTLRCTRGFCCSFDSPWGYF